MTFSNAPDPPEFERDLEIFALSPPFLAGYCHLRKDIRVIRIERLEHLQPLADYFVPDCRLP